MFPVKYRFIWPNGFREGDFYILSKYQIYEISEFGSLLDPFSK